MSTDEQLRALYAIVTVLGGWGLLAFVLIGRLMGKAKTLEQTVAQHLKLTAEMAKTLAQHDDDEDEDEEREQWNPDDEPKGELPGDEWKRA